MNTQSFLKISSFTITILLLAACGAGKVPSSASLNSAKGPRVTVTNLNASAQHVATNRAITASFYDAMDKDSVISRFSLEPNVTDYELSYDASTATLTFGPPPPSKFGIGPTTPAASLQPHTTYTAKISAGAKETYSGQTTASDYVWSFTTGDDINESPVNLGNVRTFALLGSRIVGTPAPTHVKGQIASMFALTGFVDLLKQFTYGTNAQQTYSATNLAAVDHAYNDAMDRGSAPVTIISHDILENTLAPGIYNSNASVTLSHNLVLDAGFDSDATFIFQIDGDFVMNENTSIVLSNGAKAANVFWQVSGDFLTGPNAAFKGTMLTLGDATLNDSVSVDQGRILTHSGKITLGKSNTIVVPDAQ